jgi:hypothetical protein
MRETTACRLRIAHSSPQPRHSGSGGRMSGADGVLTRSERRTHPSTSITYQREHVANRHLTMISLAFTSRAPGVQPPWWVYPAHEAGRLSSPGSISSESGPAARTSSSGSGSRGIERPHPGVVEDLVQGVRVQVIVHQPRAGSGWGQVSRRVRDEHDPLVHGKAGAASRAGEDSGRGCVAENQIVDGVPAPAWELPVGAPGRSERDATQLGQGDQHEMWEARGHPSASGVDQNRTDAGDPREARLSRCTRSSVARSWRR